MADDFQPPDAPVVEENLPLVLCGDGTPDEDHDWRYDPGDWDVGLPACWVCNRCGKIDDQREPPSDDDL